MRDCPCPQPWASLQLCLWTLVRSLWKHLQCGLHCCWFPCVSVFSCLCLLSANLPSSVQFGSVSVSSEQSMYPEFCVSHSREKSKEGAMTVFLLSASDIQVIHRQQCTTLLPAFAKGSLPLVCVPDFQADSLTFCSSEACSTHAGWFPYHFSVPTMNPDEVLVFCSPKASDYGTECREDWTPAHFGSSHSVFLFYQFYPWCKCSSEFCLPSLNPLFCQGSTVPRSAASLSLSGLVLLGWLSRQGSTLHPAAISLFANGVFVCVLCRLMMSQL